MTLSSSFEEIQKKIEKLSIFDPTELFFFGWNVAHALGDNIRYVIHEHLVG